MKGKRAESARIAFVVSVLLLLLAVAWSTRAETLTARVIRIADADTIHVLAPSNRPARLAWATPSPNC